MKNFLALSALFFIPVLSGFTPPDWIAIQNKEGRFSVLFPHKPEISIDTARTETGPVVWRLMMYNGIPDKNDNSMYGISYTDYPPEKINSDINDARVDSFLEHALSGSATGISGEVLLHEKITFKEFPGRFMKISFAGGKAVMDIKIYLVHSRCYIVQVGYSLKKEGNPSIDKFFNSFELLSDK